MSKVQCANGVTYQLNVMDTVYITPGLNFRRDKPWVGVVTKIGNKYVYVTKQGWPSVYCFHVDNKGFEKHTNEASALRLWPSKETYEEHTDRAELIDSVYRHFREVCNARISYSQAFEIAKILGINSPK